MTYKNILIIILLLLPSSLFAQSDIIGKWKTIDENSGKERSIVEFYKKGDTYCGKIVEIFPDPEENPNPICDDCDEDDDRYNMPIRGMEIIRDMTYEDEEYVGGTVLDPEEGQLYRCKLWLEDGDLMVRGYIAFFFRTQTWKKY